MMDKWEAWLWAHPPALLAALLLLAILRIVTWWSDMKWMWGRPRSDMERERERDAKKK